MKTKDELWALADKYTKLPRKGWSVKGSRKRSNETVEVNRQEVVRALQDAHGLASATIELIENELFYEKMLCALADGEDDAVECDKCSGIYLMSWFDGKCPYCEVDHKDVFAITKKEVT